MHQGEDDVLRFLLYTPAAAKEEVTGEMSPIGAGAHSDYGTMTLLFQGSYHTPASISFSINWGRWHVHGGELMCRFCGGVTG
jgi:hypothetical protein